ncbi:hypothetical protein PHYC_00126 [Phycisphaerales bacterium]|nr:hypothetical protein PHYC_00126 [Phycisphaerales bacterium]
MHCCTRVFIAAVAVASANARAQDLNGNVQQDSLEIRNGAADCNRNGVLDSIDIRRPHFSNAIEHLNGLVQFQNNVWDVCPLDFDGDGRSDLALCAFTSTNFGNIALWRNDGGPGLRFASEIPFPEARPTVLKSADLNGDGRPDLIAGDSSYNRVYVIRATGPGTFAPAVTLAGDVSNNGTVGIAVGDLDGDLDIDIAATSWGTNKVNVWRNNGNGTFGARGTYTVDFQPREVAIGDFTGDGLADLAVANEYYAAVPASASGTVSLLRNTGNAVFVTHATITMPSGAPPYNYQARPQAVALRDVDHDGDLDLITSSKLSNVLSIHHNNGSGTFTLGQTFGGISIESDARDVLVTDLDGDGWDDIAWGDPDMNIAGIYRNVNGLFRFQQNFATARYGGLYLEAADFSGDGRPDLVSANDSGRTFSILVNQGGLRFEAPVHLRPDTYPGNPLLADFTGDGVTDLGALRTNQSGSVITFGVYAGIGNTRFSPTPIDTSFAVQSFTVTRDLNSDGKQDLLTVSGRCDVRLGNGDGTFQPVISSPIQPFGLRLAVEDFNRDGALDLAWVWPGHPSTVRVSMGDNAGRFGAYAEYTVVAEDESIGAGDINGDGAPEIFTGHRNGFFEILMNNGDGTFAPRREIVITGTPLNPAIGAIAVADFDVDGDNDVVVSAATLRLFRNPGDGNLPSTSIAAAPYAASMLGVADIDLDGVPDLYGRATTGIAFINGGTGTFAQSMFLHLYDSNARGMVVADANNDGRQDVLISPENSWGHFLFLNLPQASTDGNGNGVPDECEAPSCDPDVNCDGSVNGFDIEAMEQAVNGDVSNFCQAEPDYNRDGTVNGFDIEAVEQGVNGAPCP